VAGGGNEGIHVLLGLGDGSFAPPVTYNRTNPGFVATGDFNGDHIPDLVAIDGGFRVLFGNGDGTFQSSYQTAVSRWQPGTLIMTASSIC